MADVQLIEKRFLELDWLRGLAVIAMVMYHAVFDLVFIFGFDLPLANSAIGWRVGSYLIAGTFLVLVGISLHLKYQRTKDRSGIWWRSFLYRGLVVFGLGCVITVITKIAVPDVTIWFGILQLIGASIILSLPFISQKWVGRLGIGVIGVGLVLPVIFSVTVLIFLPLGLHPPMWQSLDYFPIFPWWGLVLLGIAAGQRWYADGQRNWYVPQWLLQLLKADFSVPLIWLGRHALIVYLVHQPLLLLLFYFLFGYGF